MIKPLSQCHWFEACNSEVRGVKSANAALGELAKVISLALLLQLHSPVRWSAPSHSSVFFLHFSFPESRIYSLMSQLQSCLQESQNPASVNTTLLPLLVSCLSSYRLCASYDLIVQDTLKSPNTRHSFLVCEQLDDRCKSNEYPQGLLATQLGVLFQNTES